MPDSPENTNIWIVFDEAEQKWEVRRQDADKPVAAYENKDDAIREGRRIARREHGELTITKEDLEIEDHDSFSRSPEPEIKIFRPDEIDVSGTLGGPPTPNEPSSSPSDRSDDSREPGPHDLPGGPSDK